MPRYRWKHSLAATLLLAGVEGRALAQGPGGPCLPCLGGSAKPKHFPRPSWPDVPLGSSMNLHFQTHITAGVATRMALYDYDFVPDTAQLNVRGKDRIRQIAGWLPHNQFPVIIERLPRNPGLADARRQAVLAELAAVAGPFAAERVVVGRSPTAPLQGVEAELIYQNLLRLTDSAGTVPGTGVGGGTGTATGGNTTGTGSGGTNNR